MKISSPRGKKEDELPILPRYVGDSIIDLNDQDVDEKDRVKAEIEAVGQAKLVSGKPSLTPQPTKIIMKKKAKKNSAFQDFGEFLSCLLYPVAIFMFGVCLGRVLVHYNAESHNQLVREVNRLNKNQGIMYNGIHEAINKVNKLSVNHNYTEDKLYKVVDCINELAKELQLLKDSVNHIMEEKLHGQDEEVVVDLDDVDKHYPRVNSTENPEYDLHDRGISRSRRQQEGLRGAAPRNVLTDYYLILNS